MCVGTNCTQPHTATHACKCSRTGEQTFRHDAVKHMLFDILRSVLWLAAVVMENAMFAELASLIDGWTSHFLAGSASVQTSMSEVLLLVT